MRGSFVILMAVTATGLSVGDGAHAQAVLPEAHSKLGSRVGQFFRGIMPESSSPAAKPESAPSSPAKTEKSSPSADPVPDGFMRLEKTHKTPSVTQLTNDDLLAGLDNGAWVQTAAPDDQPLQPICKWHHPQIDELVKRALASPTIRAEITQRFRLILQKRSNDTARFHATIGLLRLGEPVPLETINQRVLDARAPVPQRIAAIFVLTEYAASLDPGKLGTIFDAWFPEPDQTLPPDFDLEGSLYRDTKGLNPASLVRQDPGMIAALLWAYVQSSAQRQAFDASQNIRVTRAANYGDETIRRVAATAFTHLAWDTIPDSLAKLLSDSEPMVRRAAIGALAAHPTKAGGEQLLKSSFDQDPAVRVDAVDGLGAFPGQATNRRLDELGRSDHPVDRRAVIRAAQKLGLDYLIRSAANDGDWMVRQEAARSLGDPKLGPVVETLRRLLNDRSPEVQVTAVDSLARLDPEDGVPGLLEALASTSRMTRSRGVVRLSKIWPAARNFNVDATPNEREDYLRKLQLAWNEERQARRGIAPSASPALAATVKAPPLEDLLVAWYQPDQSPARKSELATRLIDYGRDGVPVMEKFFEEHQSYPSPDLLRMVLAEVDPIYRELSHLWENPRETHLAAIARLEGALLERRLTNIQAVLILELLGKSYAPVVWQRLLPIVERDFPKETSVLDAEGLKHPEPAVRIATCKRIEPRVTAAHGPMLLALFEDPDRHVRIAAMQAAGHIEGDQSLPALRRALVDRDAQVRLAAAAALHRHGDPVGAQELWRLGRDPDPVVRRKVIQEVAQLAKVDPQGAARLFAQGLEDDKPSVKQEAIAGLETMLGKSYQRDQFGRPVSLQEQISKWNQLIGGGSGRSPLIPLTMIEP